MSTELVGNLDIEPDPLTRAVEVPLPAPHQPAADSVPGRGGLADRLVMLPAVTAVNRRVFRFALDRRRDLRRAYRPFQRRSRQDIPVIEAAGWRWYQLRFRFSRIRLLRRIQFFVRDQLGRGRRAVVSRHDILLGGWNGMSAYQFVRRTGQVLDSSTRLESSFYDDLLQAYDDDGEAAMTDERLRATGYFKRVSLAAAISGHHRGMSDELGLIKVTREYVDRYRDLAVPYRPGRSRPGTLARVKPIADSECFQVLDGHHRLAIALHRGAEDIEVVVTPGSATTYLQKLLLDMSWLDGSRRLYQPVELPEVRTWPLMRRCDDRLQMMADELQRAGLDAGERDLSYLDVGSCYGWFVSEMGKLGFDARGIEMDPLALELGPTIYGLDAAKIRIGDCIAILKDSASTADVVSCFSVLHHFVMGRGSSSASELMGLLSDRTRRVLFLDTGQAHESWFRWTLPQWTPEYIAAWIPEHSSFTRVEAIGVDGDGTGSFRGKFGRTLFACSR